MTDGELAIHATLANEIELAARRAMHDSAGAERQAAQDVLRKSVELRKMLERWIVTRAMTAQRAVGAAKT